MANTLAHWMDVPLGDIRGVVLLVHGLGEHSKRYRELAAWLVSQEYAVLAYDHYGHGASIGKRGTLDTETQLRDDLHHMVAIAQRQFKGYPIYLLGHSMGGLVVLDYALLYPQSIDGVIALSPALDLGVSWVKRLLIQALAPIAANMTLGNGLSVEGISRDTEVVAAYGDDPLVHDRISPRLAQYLLQAGERVQQNASEWQVPTLVLYAGADRLVNPQGSAAFVAAAPSDRVTAQCFTDAYHELHHEPDTDTFYQAIKDWLQRQSE